MIQKKILIVTEAYSKQTNGVQTTISNTVKVLEERGYAVVLVTPELFVSIPCPTYKEIRIVINPWKVGKIIENHAPDFIHVATEGPLACFAIKYLNKNNINYTTSFHTKLPEYLQLRIPVLKAEHTYKYLRWLHQNSKAVLVTTESMRKELHEKNFKNLVVWNRGVDRKIFNSSSRDVETSTIKILLYVGRVAIEKNIEAFLNLDLPYPKIVVGDGPLLEKFMYQYPDVLFTGKQTGLALASWYATADVLVFPSVTDTFGIVMIEATACGTPVAAYPVTGPIDYVKQGVTGYLDNDLKKAVEKCLTLSRDICETEAANYTWENATNIFEHNLCLALP